MKIFIGLREVAGYYHNLKFGFDQLGVESVFVDLGGQPFNFPQAKNPKWISKLNNCSQKMSRLFMKNIFLRIFWLGFLQNLISFFLFFWAIFKFDVFIFASGSTFFFYLDYPILKILDKKIICVFTGSESRPIYLNGKSKKLFERGKVFTIVVLARIQKFIISIADRFADFIVDLEPQAYFHKKKCISFLVLGYPFYMDYQKVKSGIDMQRMINKDVNILHAPSNPEVKGTIVFRKIIEKLKSKGLRIDYLEITGKTNSEVIEAINQCDFVIDELYSDTPLAGLATEAAFFGKPTVMGGYYADYLRKSIKEKYIPPSVFCNPEKIENYIGKMIVDEPFRISLGNKAMKFVRKEWNPKMVAERYLIMLKNLAPREWYFDPAKINYVYGYGLEKGSLKNILSTIVKKYGIKALCLSDKPKLESLFLNLIK